MSAQLRCKAHEGCMLVVYDDATGKPIVAGSTVVGNPTIGYGRLLAAPGGISADEADDMFGADWRSAQASASQLSCYSRLDATRQGVIVEMVFQLGLHGVRQFAQMLDALDKQDYARAADEMLDSAWARQTPSRAQRLADLMRMGDDS